ncbi:MAG: HAMP domain-containing histidine kinase [bacterium]|nr:HAMP domain-containing histidine kinase [bacterium]
MAKKASQSGRKPNSSRSTSDQLRESVEGRQREFISIASHELRTPLTALTGYLALATGTKDPEQSREFVDRAYKASQRLTTLVEDLLQVARIEEERTPFHPTVVHPDETIREIVEDLHAAVERKRIRMSLKSELTKRDVIRVDRTKFCQVLRNILDNAIKYTPPSERVAITTRVRDRMVQVRIRDWGIGIDAGNLEKIFDKFFREYTELSAAAGGTGLGLFITKQLVERQGGTLRIKSRRGEGTTVVVSFPRTRPVTRRRGATMQESKRKQT